MVLVLLAALWAVVLVPPLLRARTDHSGDSIGDFNYRLGVLGRTNTEAESVVRPRPRPVAILPAQERAAKRRREVLATLTTWCAMTFALAYLVGGSVYWGLHILADALLLAYLALWAWVRSLQAEQTAKVRYLPRQRAPELALRRTASS